MLTSYQDARFLNGSSRHVGKKLEPRRVERKVSKQDEDWNQILRLQGEPPAAKGGDNAAHDPFDDDISWKKRTYVHERRHKYLEQDRRNSEPASLSESRWNESKASVSCDNTASTSAMNSSSTAMHSMSSSTQFGSSSSSLRVRELDGSKRGDPLPRHKEEEEGEEEEDASHQGRYNDRDRFPRQEVATSPRTSNAASHRRRHAPHLDRLYKPVRHDSKPVWRQQQHDEDRSHKSLQTTRTGHKSNGTSGRRRVGMMGRLRVQREEEDVRTCYTTRTGRYPRGRKKHGAVAAAARRPRYEDHLPHQPHHNHHHKAVVDDETLNDSSHYDDSLFGGNLKAARTFQDDRTCVSLQEQGRPTRRRPPAPPISAVMPPSRGGGVGEIVRRRRGEDDIPSRIGVMSRPDADDDMPTPRRHQQWNEDRRNYDRDDRGISRYNDRDYYNDDRDYYRHGIEIDYERPTPRRNSIDRHTYHHDDQYYDDYYPTNRYSDQPSHEHHHHHHHHYYSGPRDPSSRREQLVAVSAHRHSDYGRNSVATDPVVVVNVIVDKRGGGRSYQSHYYYDQEPMDRSEAYPMPPMDPRTGREHDKDIYWDPPAEDDYPERRPEPSRYYRTGVSPPKVPSRIPSETKPQQPPPAAPAPAPASVTVPPQDETIYIEVGANVRARLRRTKETLEAIGKDFYVPATCLGCSADLFCIADCQYIFCPTCQSISPLKECETNNSMEGKEVVVQREGVGLGFTHETLFEMQSELAEKTKKSKKEKSGGRSPPKITSSTSC